MNRSLPIASATLVTLSATIALAQPAADAPPAAPSPPPAETAPAVAPEPAPAPAPTADVVAPLPEPVVEPAKKPKPAVTAVYDSGLTFATSDDLFGLKMTFRNQMRFEGARPLEDGNQWRDHFYIARTRLQAEGHLFGEDNKFKVEFGFGDAGSYAFLKEMWMDRLVADKTLVRFGMWRRPFSRQELVSDFGGHFMERSLANELAGGGRDLGVAVHNDYDQNITGLEWVVGIFNGFSGGADRPRYTTTCNQDPMSLAVTCVDSRPTTFNPDFGPTIAARVGYNSPKMKGLVESDLEGGPLRYAVAGAYKVDLANFDEGAEDGWAKNTSHGLEVDGLVKSMGFSMHVMAVLMKLKGGDPDYGLLVQPGYMLVPKKLEVAGRFSLATEHEDNRNHIEARAAVNYFIHGNAWRLGGDAGFVQYTGDGAMDDKPDLLARVQLQMQI